MHIGIAKARVDHAPRLRFVIAIGIGKEDELCGATNVCTTFYRHDRMRYG